MPLRYVATPPSRPWVRLGGRRLYFLPPDARGTVEGMRRNPLVASLLREVIWSQRDYERMLRLEAMLTVDNPLILFTCVGPSAGTVEIVFFIESRVLNQHW